MNFFRLDIAIQTTSTYTRFSLTWNNCITGSKWNEYSLLQNNSITGSTRNGYSLLQNNSITGSKRNKYSLLQNNSITGSKRNGYSLFQTITLLGQREMDTACFKQLHYWVKEKWIQPVSKHFHASMCLFCKHLLFENFNSITSMSHLTQYSLV